MTRITRPLLPAIYASYDWRKVGTAAPSWTTSALFWALSEAAPSTWATSVTGSAPSTSKTRSVFGRSTLTDSRCSLIALPTSAAATRRSGPSLLPLPPPVSAGTSRRSTVACWPIQIRPIHALSTRWWKPPRQAKPSDARTHGRRCDIPRKQRMRRWRSSLPPR